MTRKKPTTPAKQLADQAAALAQYAAQALVAAEQLRIKTKVADRFPLNENERAVLAGLSPVTPKILKNLAKGRMSWSCSIPRTA